MMIKSLPFICKNTVVSSGNLWINACHFNFFFHHYEVFILKTNLNSGRHVKKTFKWKRPLRATDGVVNDDNRLFVFRSKWAKCLEANFNFFFLLIILMLPRCSIQIMFVRLNDLNLRFVSIKWIGPEHHERLLVYFDS